MAADDAAVTVTLRAALKDYEAGLKAAVRVTEKNAAQIEKLLKDIGSNARPNFKPLNDNFQKSAGQIANDARIMQFQLNDIFSGLASGQGIRALQMQLGQIAQILGGGGLAAGARTLGTAMLGMINPINLAVVAFGLAAAAATDYFFGSEEGAKEAEKAQKKLNEELKRQQTLLKEVVTDWKEAPAALREIVAAQERLEQLRKSRQGITIGRKELLAPITDALRNAEPQVRDFFELFESPVIFPQFSKTVKEAGQSIEFMISQLESGGGSVAEIRKFLDDMIGVLKQLPGPYAAQLAEQLEKIRTTLIGVTPQVNELDKAMNTLGQDSSRVLQGMLQGFQNLLGPLGPLIGAVRELAGALPGDLGGTFMQGVVQMPAQFRAAVTASGDAARAFLQTKAATDAIGASMVNLTDEMAIATAKLFTMLPETARITSAVRSRQQQAEAYARYRAGTGGVAAPPGRSRHEVGAAVDIGQGVSMETLRAAVKMVPELEQLDRVSESLYQRDKVHVQLKGTAARINEEQARTIEQQADATARAQENLQNYLTSLDEQASLATRINEINTTSTLNADQKRVAIEVETELQRALNQARQDGITLTDADIAKIREKAAANAQAGNEALAISERQKLAADAARNAQESAIKAVQKQAQVLQQLQQTLAGMATQAVVGFVQDLRNGVSAAEALYNVVSRIADQLLQMVVQAAMMKLFGSLLGVPAVPFVGGPGGLYASGGYTGDRPTGQAAGIVHGQEFVVNAKATRQHRALLEAINRGAPGYSSGGFVLPRLPGYARGGFVQPPPAQQQFNTRTTVVNTFDSGSFLSEALSRPDGVNVILNAVRAQPGAFRQAMQG
jgi:hypothetical protein